MIVNKLNIQSLLLAFIPFTSLLIIPTSIGDFNFYLYPLCIFLFFLMLGVKYYIKLLFCVFLILPFMVFHKVLIGYPISPLFKQIIPIIVIYFGLYFSMKRLGYVHVFNSYLKVSLVVSLFGIAQFFLFVFFNNVKLSPFGYRVNSIVSEPSHLAIILLPAFIYFFIDVLNNKKNHIKCGIIFMCIILTQSLSVFISFLIILPFILTPRTTLKIFLIMCILTPFVMGYMSADENLNNRLSAVSETINGDYDYRTGQETVYSALTNVNVSIYSFLETYGLGVGLGGHPTSYDVYFENKPEVYLRESSYEINKLNGHNLFIRGVSELGVLFLFLVFSLFFLIVKNKKLRKDWIFIACLSYLLSRFVKLGGYFDHGLPIFIITMLLIILDNKSEKEMK